MRNYYTLARANNFRCQIDLWEACDAERDLREYVVWVRVGRYGRWSLDPSAEGVAFKVEGTYLGGLDLDRPARIAYKIALSMLPEPYDATDPLRAGAEGEIADNAQVLEKIRARIAEKISLACRGVKG
jgi:hypothetical protein